MLGKGIFVGATGQNVGKTTLCLGIFSGLRRRFGSVGFIKPVGQQHVEVEDNILVDKDVELIRKQFALTTPWRSMSPVLIPGGFTRRYLDQETTSEALLDEILQSFKRIQSTHEFTLVEGTGHLGVGSIVNLNNARIAKALDLDMVIIASGGLGSSFDEIALNKSLCDHYGVNIRGVILNRVLDEKRQMVLDYFPKALETWGIPLLGCIPYNSYLSTCCMNDFSTFFSRPLLSGEQHRWRHFSHTRLVAGSLEAFSKEYTTNELIITPGSRLDILSCVVQKHQNNDFQGGVIITGQTEPDQELIKQMTLAKIPAIHIPIWNYEAMREITHFTAKIRKEDGPKVHKAIDLVEKYINFDLLYQKNS